MNKRLFVAVAEQMGFELDERELRENLDDVARGGANAGWSGFTYYNETSEFFDANRALIVAELKEQASEFGVGMLEFVASFNCLNNDYSVDEIGEVLFGAGDDDSATYIKNACAWFALELAAMYAENYLESDEE